MNVMANPSILTILSFYCFILFLLIFLILVTKQMTNNKSQIFLLSFLAERNCVEALITRLVIANL